MDPTTRPQSPPLQAPVEQTRVLIVEDDLTSAGALRAILERAGCGVWSAETLALGLSMLSSKPHFVILDLMLPDGNGIELLRQLRAASSNARVIVTTAASDPVLMQDVQTLRPFRIFRKPIDLVDLLAAMGKM